MKLILASIAAALCLVNPAIAQQPAANTVYAGPSTGSPAPPSFRALVGADIPAGIGTGDVISDTASSVSGDVPIFSNTNGLHITDPSPPGIQLLAAPGPDAGWITSLPLYTPNGVGASVIFGNNLTYTGAPHEFIGCTNYGSGCTIRASAAGSTAFIGNDGSNPTILGAVSGSDFHMTALGSSVDCEGGESICIGHGATAKNAVDIVIGGSDTSTIGGTETLLGTTDTGSGGHVIGVNGNGFGTGSSDSIQIDNRTCSPQTNSFTIELGYGACATVQGHIVIGGSSATAFYVGSESVAIPIHGETLFSGGNAPSNTDFGTCAHTAGSWIGGSSVGTFTASGACPLNGTYEFNLATSEAPPHAMACNWYDTSAPLVVMSPSSPNNFGRTIAATVISATGVSNGDTIQVSCQGY